MFLCRHFQRRLMTKLRSTLNAGGPVAPHPRLSKKKKKGESQLNLPSDLLSFLILDVSRQPHLPAAQLSAKVAAMSFPSLMDCATKS